MHQQINSKVWQMHGPFRVATAGMLTLNNGVVTFLTEEGQQFQVLISEVKEVKWPFFQFGLGFTTVVNNKKYKFTFMRPNGAGDLDTSAIGGLLGGSNLGGGLEAIANLANWSDNKKSGKQWKAVLGK